AAARPLWGCLRRHFAAGFSLSVRARGELYRKKTRHECARGDGWIEVWAMGAELGGQAAVRRAAAGDGVVCAGYRRAPGAVSGAAGDGRQRAVYPGRNTADGSAFG